MKLELGDCAAEMAIIKYAFAEGHVEFLRKSSKKLQRGNKWSRPCKLQVAYSGTDSTNFMVHLIIYEGNVKCRRNLMKDFESAESSND